MERPTVSLDQLLNVSGKTSTTLTLQQRSSLVKELGLLMKQVRANYPAQSITEATAMIWIDQWLEIVQEYGLDQFKQALRMCMKVKLFLPLPGDINQQLQQQKQAHEDGLRAKRIAGTWVKCEPCNCGSSSEGWVLVPGGVVRSKCWEEARRRRAALNAQ